MSIISFIVFLTIILYCIGYTIYGFWERMSQEITALDEFSDFFRNLRMFLDYVGFIPMYFGNFIAWLLIKLNDFFNYIRNLFKKKK